MEPGANPFTVLTLIAAPAILANACSVLAMNTANRSSRVIDRFRYIEGRLERLAPRSPAYERWDAQLRSLGRRAEWLMRAQESFYASVGLFVAAAIVAVIGAALGPTSAVARVVMADVAAGIGILATATLLRGCVLVVRESRRTIRDMRRETRLGEAERESAFGRLSHA